MKATARVRSTERLGFSNFTRISPFQVLKCSKLTTSQRPLTAYCIIKCGKEDLSTNAVTAKDGADHVFLVSEQL